jgi:NitT/TauT family transport system permease protein
VIFPRPRVTNVQRLLLTLAGACILFGLWITASSIRSNGFDRIPSPTAVVHAGFNLVISGELPLAALASTRRVLTGFSIAMFLGTWLGWVVGLFLIPRYAVLPINSFFRYIPPTAFITLLIIYFGVGESYKYAVVFVGLFFFVLQMVVDAVEDVDIRYIEMALTSGFEQSAVLRYIVIPATLPRLVDIGRINLSAAWTLIVVAEVVGSENGLGHFLSVSQRFNRIEELYVGIVTFGVIGFAFDFLLQLFGKITFPWSERQ